MHFTGNNLMSAYYGEKVHEVEKNRSIKTKFRLLAALPPLIAAYFISDIGRAITYTGVSGFILAFIFPALLGIFSKKRVLENSLKSSTYYSVPMLTSDINTYITLYIGIFLVIYVVVNLIINSE